MSPRGFYALCTAGCLGGWLWVAACMSGGGGQGVWKGCLFKAVFHVPCPSCGSTRAVAALLRGDVAGAMAFNPLGVVVLAVLVLLPLFLLADGLRRRASLYRLFVQADRLLQRRRVLAAFACLMALNWAWVLAH